ncbi:MAG TPA: alpha/beta hydrolase fold domain-containing protein, partial [Candidatus Limnocylindrales bacterium]|nr:alpha/beta hydrolase fold domain-containing protein [Candidatus Limnocylindrales bacterium]
QRGLAGVALITLAATALLVGQVLAFSGALNAPISLTRSLAVSGAGSGTPDRIVTFATVDGTDLHAEIWQPPSGAANGPTGGQTGRAAVVYVHGGAFVGGELRLRPTLFRSLADGGFPVIDVEYRLAPPPRWDQATPDVLCALTWAAAHAQELGIDPARIVVMGDSAGGNLALMAAYGAGTAQLTSSCGGTPARPAAVVAIAPTADLVGIWGDDTIGAAGLRFPEAYIGGNPLEQPDRYRTASPFSLIQPGLPSTLVITGNIDHLVRLGRVTELTYRLHFAGVDCTLVVVPFADHGFDGGANGYGAQVEETILPLFIAAHTGGVAWQGPACPATTVGPQ